MLRLLSITESKLMKRTRQITQPRRRLLFPSALLLFSAAIGLPSQAAPPEPIFSLDFENDFIAQARGSGEPTASSVAPERVEGIEGDGALFNDGQVLQYQSAKNFEKSEGTLSLWLKTPSGKSLPSGPLTLFSEAGPDEAGSARLNVELYPGRFLRASIKDPRDTYLYFRGLDQWEEGEWQHVAVVWNNRKGALMYINGRIVTTGWMPAWETKAFDEFSIGALNRDGDHAARVAMDDFAIYDRELKAAELRDLYQERRQLSARVKALDPFIAAGKAARVTLAIDNPGNRPVTLESIQYSILDESGSVAQKRKLSQQSIAAGQSKDIQLPVKKLSSGAYSLRLEYREAGERREMNAKLFVMESRVAPSPREGDMTFLAEIDAVDREPVAQSGGTEVVNASFGSYREAGDSQHDRFALDFEVEEANEPHVAVISYPDDKRRTMEIMLQDFGNTIDFQVHSGVFAGEEYPNSQGMLEHRVVFWPRSLRQAFVFMTMEDGYPAAVSSIKIYRLNSFPVASREGEYIGSHEPRGTGLYYEDPVLFHSFGTARDGEGFMQATDRLVDYMRMFGQTEFVYPLVWYTGPLYGTTVEPIEPDIEGAQGGVRPHPAGYPRYLLQRLGENGMKFTAGMHIHTLPSLNKFATTDWEDIEKGNDTVINVNKDGTLWHGYWHGSDPNYNAADPRVMEAVNRIVDEIAQRYGKDPAFDGVSLTIARPKVFSFGSIRSGYNDSNLQRFQKETRVTIPVYNVSDAKRFTKAYEWLMARPEAKAAWIDWRARVLQKHYIAMADRLAAVRPDLKLKMNVFVHYTNNTRLANYLHDPSGEAMREMGIDPDLYKDHPNIILDYTIIPADLRWGRTNLDLPNHGVGRTVMTAPEVVDSVSEFPNLQLTIHDRYWEDSIGKEQPLAGLKDLGVNEMVWRASTLNPGSFYSLEPYVLALHNLDVRSVSKGGYVIGTFDMEEELARFSQAMLTLPAVKFDDVPDASDPVRVRQKVVDGKRYFYVLNVLPEPATTTIKLSGTSDVHDPTSGETWNDVQEVELSLAPYQLRSFIGSESAGVVSAETRLDASWLSELENRKSQLLNDAEAKGMSDGEYAAYLELAREAWREGRYARLYYLLQEHWVSEILD